MEILPVQFFFEPTVNARGSVVVRHGSQEGIVISPMISESCGARGELVRETN
jgi:hypothetical protein